MNTSLSNPELNSKVKKTTEKISENIHIVANEPSLAFYRIQENVRKVIPFIVDKKTEVQNLKEELQGKCYDLEYNVETVKTIEAAEEPLKNIQELLKNAIFLKQQLKYEETRRKKDTSSSRDSVYKRLSAHITLDLPDLDLSGMTSGINNIMSRNPNTGSSSELQRSHTTLH
ncbi:unnamed protein product [Diamesa serratosioi]